MRSDIEWWFAADWDQKWFQLQWSNMIRSHHIEGTYSLSTGNMGKIWSCLTIQFMCYNSAGKQSLIRVIVKTQMSCMHLVWCLGFIKTKFQFCLFASYIKGINNDIADALSRNNLSYFQSYHLQDVKTLSIQLLSHKNWWISSWYPSKTGHMHAGPLCGALFSQWTAGCTGTRTCNKHETLSCKTSVVSH